MDAFDASTELRIELPGPAMVRLRRAAMIDREVRNVLTVASGKQYGSVNGCRTVEVAGYNRRRDNGRGLPSARDLGGGDASTMVALAR
jgi:hypothetical protein